LLLYTGIATTVVTSVMAMVLLFTSNATAVLTSTVHGTA
jgi:hypothetical protein